MSVNSKMTAIADKIRVLSGTEEAMGLDDMATHVGEANEDVATEASLIEQIASALNGKAGAEQNIEKFFPYKVTVSSSGINNAPTPVICYGSDKDTIAVMTYSNHQRAYETMWAYENCTSGIQSNSVYIGDFAIFNEFTGDANIVITWTQGSSGDY